MRFFKTLCTYALSLVAINMVAQQAQQEVVIIGTMHTVPGIVAQAYKPMLKKAIKYQPQDIYVERQPAWDSVSVKNYFPEFYANSDSLSKVMEFDESEILKLLAKPTGQLSKEEANLLRQYFYAKLDYANMEFYRRVTKYGIDGYGKPSRNENGDLTYPLAIAMGIKNIKSMDNQTYYTEYQKYWQACDQQGQADGEYKNVKKILRQSTWNQYMGVMFMSGVGRLSNKPKNYKAYHELNSMEYRKTACEPCDQANYYWDYRNNQMVKNTAEQILESGNERNVVVVGAGHVYGMMEAFARDYPQIKVIGYNDIVDYRGKVDPKDNISETVMVSHR